MRSSHHGRSVTADPARPAAPDATGPGPAVARVILGARLRELREGQYLSRRDAAEAIRVTDAHIGAVERGQAACRPRDVADLLTIYGLPPQGPERAVLENLAEQANVAGWWAAYGDAVPDWFATYLGLEQTASVIRTFEPHFVPGLLQTADYARALIRAGHVGSALTDAQLQRRVDLRMRRQEVLYGPRPPHLWAVIDEAALRRPLGGVDTMRAQLRHLAEACRLPHVTLQILPLTAGGQVVAGGPVSLLRLAERGLPDIVYLEQLRSARYPEDPEETDFYRHLTDRLVTIAEPATDTPALLGRLLRDPPPEHPG